jgi:hypothetical protein
MPNGAALQGKHRDRQPGGTEQNWARAIVTFRTKESGTRLAAVCHSNKGRKLISLLY